MTAADALRVLVVGAGGRMGLALREALSVESGLTPAGFVDSKGRPEREGTDVPWWRTLREVDVPADGVVEFTHGGEVGGIALTCSQRGWPLVSGTTALTRGDEDGLREASREIPILRASNMSIGVVLLRRCMLVLSSLAPVGTELEIVEIHHGGKWDAPSGTARSFFGLWSQLRGEDLREIHGRSGQPGPRAKEEVGVHALRLGEVVGEHQLHFAIPGGERIELTHRVAGRVNFARGALHALARLVGRAPGLYELDDLYE